MDHMLVAWMTGVFSAHVLEDVEFVHWFQASIRIGSQYLYCNMTGSLGAALVIIVRHYEKFEECLRQIFCQPDSRVHAVAEFGYDLIFGVEVFAKLNRVVATGAIAFGGLFERY
jgi:hypothetical protein